MTLKALPLALGLFAISFTFFAVQSGDALMYLNLARDFVFTEGWPRIDSYTYALDHPPLIWTHEYLSFILFYGAYQILGFGGLIALKMLTWGLVFVLVLGAKPKENSTTWVFVGLWILAVIAGSFRFIERSSMFSDLILVWLCGYLLSRDRLDRRMLFKLFLLFFVWAQIHPAFPLGLALVGLWAVNRWIRGSVVWRQLLWLAGLPIALVIHPDGFDGLLYPFRFAFNEASVFKKYNYEWLPSYHFLFRFAPETMAFWLLTLLALILILRQRAWLELRTWFALFAMICAVSAVRFIPWASFAMILCLKPWAEFRLVRARPGRFLAPALSAFLILIAVKNFAFGYSSSSGERLPQFGPDPKFFPDKTVDFYLKNSIQGRLYNAHDFGSYLIWRGATPVFHHGFMTDVGFYENDVMGVFRGQARFLELAAKYNWTMLLVEKHGNYRYFYQILAPLPEWKIVAEDDAAYLIYRLPN